MRAIRPCWMLVFAAIVLAMVVDVGRSQQLGTLGALKSAIQAGDKRYRDIISPKADDEKVQLNAGDKKLADDLAKYYLYRITHRGAQDPAKVQSEFESFIKGMDKKTKVLQTFIEKYLSPALVSTMQEVLAIDPKENPGIYVNACMMLPTMARLRSAAVGDYLITLVDGKNEVARLHALRGMREFMPIQVFTDSDKGFPEKEEKRVRDGKSVSALTRYIERRVDVSNMIPERAAVVHFFRQEAIASLAQGGAPAVSVNKKGSTIETPVAPTLLRVLAEDIEPRPTLQEKLEAAVGVCSMKYNNVPEYVPEIAAYLVGKTMVEFVKEYNKDLLNLKGKDRKLPPIAWKAESLRLEQAVKELKANAAAVGAKTGADRLESLLVKGSILKKMQKYDQPEAADVFDLENSVPKMRPADGTVFKYIKTSPVIKLN